MQGPESNFNLEEDSGKTNLIFTGTATSALYDANSSSIPRGGIIVSVASSNGFGLQPLVSAGGTAIISNLGTIQSVSIGNSGSGYRSGLQIVNVFAQTNSYGIPNIESIGIANILNGNVIGVNITNNTSIYTQSNPPEIIFDTPLSYSNLDLKYYSSSVGVGTEAKVDIVVGQGSSVIDFEITNFGYSYKEDELLTVEYGGISGIPTDTSKIFDPFLIRVNRVYEDEFSAWSIGSLQQLDDISSLVDGKRRSFPILDNGNRFSIISRPGSNIDIKAVILVFVNDVLQQPTVAYEFNGGSIIRFTEAPQLGSKIKIIFYRGTEGVDVKDVDIAETIKKGDTVKIQSDELQLNENERLVTDILTPKIIETNPYRGDGLTDNEELLRPIVWTKQRQDLIIDGEIVTKTREIYEPKIYPVTNIIQNIGIGDSMFYVENVKTIFDNKQERSGENQESIEIISENFNLPAVGIASIGIGISSIISIQIIDGGFGYTSIPTISISDPGPDGLRATASANIVNGSIISIDIIESGYGYKNSNPPIVLIETPDSITKEIVNRVSYFGDFGIISGITTTSLPSAPKALVFDLIIPPDSFLQDFNYVDDYIRKSSIKPGYYFSVFNSNVGYGITSYRSDGSIIGIGTTCIDNIYQVISVSIGTTEAYGIIDEYPVAKITVSVDNFDGLGQLSHNNFYGEYSWGLIIPKIRSKPKEFIVNSNYGIVGLNTTPFIRRKNYLNFKNS
jgi:hypothetical protein